MISFADDNEASFNVSHKSIPEDISLYIGLLLILLPHIFSLPEYDPVSIADKMSIICPPSFTYKNINI